MCRDHINPIHCIIPPYVIENMAHSNDPDIRQLGIDTMLCDTEARSTRFILSRMPSMAAIPSPAGEKHRLVYDMEGNPPFMLPGRLARIEGQENTDDPAVNEAYHGSGHVYDFFLELFFRNSLDNNGMSLVSSVHVGRNYNNAFWNGEQMAYGDGDNRIFLRFTKSLDVIGHELTHGVVAHTSNLVYRDQSGALNEHFADVFGSLVKQWRYNQTADQADWLIGNDIIGPALEANSLRNMTADKAYENDPILGTDPQPKHMDNLYTGTADNGGVHINSGIPNYVFYQVATRLGGNAWEQTGRVWYETLLRLNSRSDFQECANMTAEVAGRFYGERSDTQNAVESAWNNVGIEIQI